jgi:hypothetical protein
MGVIESSCTFVVPGINRSLLGVTKNLPVIPVIIRDLSDASISTFVVPVIIRNLFGTKRLPAGTHFRTVATSGSFVVPASTGSSPVSPRTYRSSQSSSETSLALRKSRNNLIWHLQELSRRPGAALTKFIYNYSTILLRFFNNSSPRAFPGFLARNPSQPQ